MSRVTVGSPPQQRMRAVLRRLRRAYPEARTALEFRTPWELLVATMLSAQTTDARVNQVTPALFARYPDVEALAGADVAEVTQLIHATGYHNQKARALVATARALLERYEGRVPRTIAALVTLPGVGRKTAAVVSGNAFGRNEGIAVDTHVGRIVRRLGFTQERDPVRVERVLLELVPAGSRTIFTHLLISHGRAVCTARSPACADCVLLDLCPDGLARVSATPRQAQVAAGTRRAAEAALPARTHGR